MLQDIQNAIDCENIISQTSYTGENLFNLEARGLEFGNVMIENCHFTECSFLSAGFFEVQFLNCIFEKCGFANGYFRNCMFTSCQADNCNFSQSSFRTVEILGGSYVYTNFANTLWENSRIESNSMKNAFFSETKLKKTSFHDVNLSGTDFFKTSLKGLDLSSCIIEGIQVSDSFSELKGLKINLSQAADVAMLLGVKIC